MYNKVILIGYVGRDPEIRYSTSGLAIANLSMATTHKSKGEQTTTWHNLIAFDRTAEIFGEYVKKGHLIQVDGRLQINAWEKDGVKHSRPEIVVEKLTMLGKSQGDNQSYQNNRQKSAAPPQQPRYSNPNYNVPDDDIPF